MIVKNKGKDALIFNFNCFRRSIYCDYISNNTSVIFYRKIFSR